MEGKDQDTKSRVVWRVVDDEALIVDLHTGGFFSLNPIGTEIWKGLHDGMPIERIVDTIAAKYGVDPATVRNDVSELIAELNQEGLVE